MYESVPDASGPATKRRRRRGDEAALLSNESPAGGTANTKLNTGAHVLIAARNRVAKSYSNYSF